MSVSVYIPSIPQDFKNTPEIAQAYLSGPIKPDQIVVCLSGAEQVEQTLKDRLRSIAGVELHEHDEWLQPGPNRNLAKQYCSGDIIAYQDADDLPHPRRIQICSSYFTRPETSHIMVLNHGYAHKKTKLHEPGLFFPKVIASEKLFAAYFPHGIYNECISITKNYGNIRRFKAMICTGALFIRKEVLEQVQWRHPNDLQLKVIDRSHHETVRFAEDYEFCMECLFKLKRSMIISSPLYYYRYW